MAKKTKTPKKGKNDKTKKPGGFDSLPLKNLFIVSLAFSALTIGFVFWSIKHLPPEIPIFYGKPVSQERLGDAGMLVLPAFSSLVMTVFNLVVSLIIKNQYFKKILAVATITTTLFAVTTTLKIFFLIGKF